MDIIVNWNAHVADVEAVRVAEDVGISHVGVGTGPLLFADPFQYLALASQVSSSIKLGTMVLDPVTRTPPVVANSLATLNALAPGRVFVGMGAGNNAMHSMGLKSATPRELGDAVRVIRALTRGERADWNWHDQDTLLELLSVGDGRMRVDQPVPIHIAAGGPKGMKNAAEFADALVFCVGPDVNFIRIVRAELDRLVAEAGRPPGSVQLIGQTWFYETGPGETWEDALTNGFGMTAPMASVSTDRQFLRLHREEIGGEIVDRSLAAAQALMGPPDTVGAADHLDQWKHYAKEADPRHKSFMSKELIDFWCLYGTKSEIRESSQAMTEGGLDGLCLTLYNTGAIHRDMATIGRVLID